MFCTHFHLLLILGFLISVSTATKNHGCKRILNELANEQGVFVNCITRTSDTANSCVECFQNHKNVSGKYAELVSNHTCYEEMLNNNRWGIVYNLQKSITDIWNKGFCDDCFCNGSTSIEMNKFNSLAQNLTNCIQDNYNNNKSSVCVICTVQYAGLNGFYKQMDETKKGKICFDMQNEMNKTRSLWSKELKCCHRDYNFTFFIIASSLFAALPIIFYSGMYGYTKRMERNHEVLDADLDSGPASTSTGVISGTMSHIEDQQPQRDDLSDDDERIDIMKKQRIVSASNDVSKKSSSHPEKVKTLEQTSSTSVAALIEL